MSRAARFFAILVSILTSGLTALAPDALGQQAVDPSQRYHRLICLVHFIGSGKQGDEVRPEYVPKSTDKPSRSGIVSWSSLPTDDGKMAIIHIVSTDRNAFAAVFADTRPEIKVFAIGKEKPAAIEAAMQMYRKSFTLAAFRVMAR